MQVVLTWLQKYYLLRLETKLALLHSSQFFNHILRLPAAYFGQRFAGEIGSRVLDQRQGRQDHRRASWRPTAIDLCMIDLLRRADVVLRRQPDARRSSRVAC